VDAREVGAFLSALAVEHRASQSTQKQALNALVFLLEEALQRHLGEIPFQRAEAGRKVPTVLTRAEISALSTHLRGTSRLMAELAYGSGLRLMELLRLRVHHLDLPRQRLQVYDGKGAKHRITLLPAKLVPELEIHVARLQHLHAGDRAAGLAGVCLPEGLAAKYTRAGERFEWQWLFPSREASVDPASGQRRRHHVTDSAFQRAIVKAAAQAGITKRVTPHVLRHCVLRTPLRYAPGPALDANRGLTIYARPALRRLRRICWRAERISGRCRNCSGTRAWRRRKSTRT
jgi:integrase